MTPRDIIDKALRKIGETGSGSSPTSDEIQDSLDELNMLIDQCNQSKMYSYTEHRLIDIPLNSSKKSVTISDMNAEKVASIVSNGFINTITLYNDESDLALYNIIRTYDCGDNYIADKTILEITGETIITAPESYPEDSYDIDAILFSSSTEEFSIVTPGANPYDVGDVLMVTDNDTFVAFGTVSAKPDERNLSFTGYTSYHDDNPSYYNVGHIFKFDDRIITPDNSGGGYIHQTSAIVADIIAPRPYYIERIIDSDGSREIRQSENEEWNSTRSGFTYYTDYPRGTIEYNNISGNVSIQYKKLNEQLKLYEEINLPPGYASAWVYELARLMGIEFGCDVTAIAFEASNRMRELRKVNAHIPLQSSQTPGSRNRSDFNSGRLR